MRKPTFIRKILSSNLQNSAISTKFHFWFQIFQNQLITQQKYIIEFFKMVGKLVKDFLKGSWLSI